MKSLGEMVRRSQPSLFWCTRGLPRANREAVYTLFAFCHHLDDVVRSSMSSEEKIELLKVWQDELDNIYDVKVPKTNIGRKIYKNCIRFDLPKKMWQQILQSAFLDAGNPLQAPDKDTFEKFISGTAIVPLHLALMVMSPEHPRANQELAKNLGQAVAITYLLRDIKGDAKRERMYLPDEILKKAKVDIEKPQTMLENKNLAEARAKAAEIAEIGYAKAERLLSKMSKTTTMPIRLVLNTSQSLFNEMAQRGWEIISPKPRLSWWKRLRILIDTLFS